MNIAYAVPANVPFRSCSMKQLCGALACALVYVAVTPMALALDDRSPEERLAASLARAYTDYQADVAAANAELNVKLAAIEEAYLVEQRRALVTHDRKALIAAYCAKLNAIEDARQHWQDTIADAMERFAQRRAAAYDAYLRNR